MSKRIAITVPDRVFLQIMAICRVEHRRPAELARIFLESAIEQGMRPSQKLLFEADRDRNGSPALRLIRGGKNES